MREYLPPVHPPGPDLIDCVLGIERVDEFLVPADLPCHKLADCGDFGYSWAHAGNVAVAYQLGDPLSASEVEFRDWGSGK